MLKDMTAHSPEESIVALAEWHVDDFEFMGRPTDMRWSEAREALQRKLQWKEWESTEYMNLGTQTKQWHNGSVTLEQKSFLDTLEPIEIDFAGREDSGALASSEVTQYRG